MLETPVRYAETKATYQSFVTPAVPAGVPGHQLANRWHQSLADAVQRIDQHIDTSGRPNFYIIKHLNDSGGRHYRLGDVVRSDVWSPDDSFYHLAMLTHPRHFHASSLRGNDDYAVVRRNAIASGKLGNFGILADWLQEHGGEQTQGLERAIRQELQRHQATPFRREGSPLRYAAWYPQPPWRDPTPIYEQMHAFLGKKDQRRISPNKSMRRAHPFVEGQRKPDIHLTLHGTDVVVAHPDGTFTLDTGGYNTSTIRTAINDFSGAGFHYHRFEPLVNGRPFFRGLRVGPRGMDLFQHAPDRDVLHGMMLESFAGNPQAKGDLEEYIEKHRLAEPRAEKLSRRLAVGGRREENAAPLSAFRRAPTVRKYALDPDALHGLLDQIAAEPHSVPLAESLAEMLERDMPNHAEVIRRRIHEFQERSDPTKRARAGSDYLLQPHILEQIQRLDPSVQETLAKIWRQPTKLEPLWEMYGTLVAFHRNDLADELDTRIHPTGRVNGIGDATSRWTTERPHGQMWSAEALHTDYEDNRPKTTAIGVVAYHNGKAHWWYAHMPTHEAAKTARGLLDEGAVPHRTLEFDTFGHVVRQFREDQQKRAEQERQQAEFEAKRAAPGDTPERQAVNESVESGNRPLGLSRRGQPRRYALEHRDIQGFLEHIVREPDNPVHSEKLSDFLHDEGHPALQTAIRLALMQTPKFGGAPNVRSYHGISGRSPTFKVPFFLHLGMGGEMRLATHLHFGSPGRHGERHGWSIEYPFNHTEGHEALREVVRGMLGEGVYPFRDVGSRFPGLHDEIEKARAAVQDNPPPMPKPIPERQSRRRYALDPDALRGILQAIVREPENHAHALELAEHLGQNGLTAHAEAIQRAVAAKPIRTGSGFSSSPEVYSYSGGPKGRALTAPSEIHGLREYGTGHAVVELLFHAPYQDSPDGAQGHGISFFAKYPDGNEATQDLAERLLDERSHPYSNDIDNIFPMLSDRLSWARGEQDEDEPRRRPEPWPYQRSGAKVARSPSRSPSPRRYALGDDAHHPFLDAIVREPHNPQHVAALVKHLHESGHKPLAEFIQAAGEPHLYPYYAKPEDDPMFVHPWHAGAVGYLEPGLPPGVDLTAYHHHPQIAPGPGGVPVRAGHEVSFFVRPRNGRTGVMHILRGLANHGVPLVGSLEDEFPTNPTVRQKSRQQQLAAAVKSGSCLPPLPPAAVPRRYAMPGEDYNRFLADAVAKTHGAQHPFVQALRGLDSWGIIKKASGHDEDVAHGVVIDLAHSLANRKSHDYDLSSPGGYIYRAAKTIAPRIRLGSSVPEWEVEGRRIRSAYHPQAHIGLLQEHLRQEGSAGLGRSQIGKRLGINSEAINRLMNWAVAQGHARMIPYRTVGRTVERWYHPEVQRAAPIPKPYHSPAEVQKQNILRRQAQDAAKFRDPFLNLVQRAADRGVNLREAQRSLRLSPQQIQTLAAQLAQEGHVKAMAYPSTRGTGTRWFHPSVQSPVLPRAGALQRIEQLRELIAAGHSQVSAAKVLGISPQAVNGLMRRLQRYVRRKPFVAQETPRYADDPEPFQHPLLPAELSQELRSRHQMVQLTPLSEEAHSTYSETLGRARDHLRNLFQARIDTQPPGLPTTKGRHNILNDVAERSDWHRRMTRALHGGYQREDPEIEHWLRSISRDPFNMDPRARMVDYLQEEKPRSDIQRGDSWHDLGRLIHVDMLLHQLRGNPEQTLESQMREGELQSEFGRLTQGDYRTFGRGAGFDLYHGLWNTRQNDPSQRNRWGVRQYAAAADPRHGSFLSAMNLVRSTNQNIRTDVAKDITTTLGLLPAYARDTVHDSPLGSQPGMTIRVNSAERPKIDYAAAWYALLTQMPGVVAFHRGAGDDLLHTFETKQPANQIRAILDRFRIPDRTIAPTKGGFRVQVFDRGGSLGEPLGQAAGKLGAQLESIGGQGNFLGTGDPGTYRESLRRTIRSYEQKLGGSSSRQQQ